MKLDNLKMKIDKIKKLLLENNVHIEQGLSDDEVRKIEKIYNVKFSQQWLEFYQNILPVSERFYNWRDFSVENIAAIKERLASPYNGILESIDEIVWDISWGLEPARVEEKNKKIRKKITRTLPNKKKQAMRMQKTREMRKMRKKARRRARKALPPPS